MVSAGSLEDLEEGLNTHIQIYTTQIVTQINNDELRRRISITATARNMDNEVLGEKIGELSRKLEVLQRGARVMLARLGWET